MKKICHRLGNYREHKPSGRAISDTHRDAIITPKARKPLRGQLELDLKPAINPDWPEPSTKLFHKDKEPKSD